jgi:hypothetical protein
VVEPVLTGRAAEEPAECLGKGCLVVVADQVSENMAGSMAKYLATSLVMEKVVRRRRADAGSPARVIRAWCG